jgi:hypothetical protein
MANTEISEYKQHVAPDLLPCPGPLVEREIRNVLIDFCDKTHVLTKEFNVVIDSDQIVEDDHNSLDIELTDYFSDAAPGIIIGFVRDGLKYRPERKELVNDVPDSMWVPMERIGAIYFTFPTNKVLRIFDVDSTWTNLYVIMSIKPTRTSTTVDPLIYEHHLDTIVAGVKYKVLSMPGKEWSENRASREAFTQYRRGLSSCKARVMRRYSGWPMEVSPRSFNRIDWGV